MSIPLRASALWSVLIGLVLTVGIWTAIALENEHDLHTDLRNAEISASNLAILFEKHVSESINLIDQSILHFRDDYEHYGRIDERFEGHILNRVLPGTVQHVSILDRDGRLAYSSAKNVVRDKQDFSDREYFQQQRDAKSDELSISTPVQDRLTKRWVIQFVRQLHSKGKFAGVVVFSMDAMHFVHVHAGLDVGQEGAINLVGMDGVVRARVSHAGTRNEFFGHRVPDDRPFFDVRQPPQGIYVTRSAIDGVERIGAWRRLPDAPLVVLVLLSKAEVLAAHRARQIGSYWIGGFLTLIFMGGAVLIGALLSKSAAAAQAMEKMATTDALTGLANRRYFYTGIANEFERARRYARPLSVIMLDIDFFKRINDTHGHAVGDDVLRLVAACWARSIRKHDLLGRVGGEEFCVMLPETNEEDAVIVAEGLREAVVRQGVSAGQGQTVIATASFGVAMIRSEDVTFESLLSRADAALYAAKREGRNRVQAYSSLRDLCKGNSSEEYVVAKIKVSPTLTQGSFI